MYVHNNEHIIMYVYIYIYIYICTYLYMYVHCKNELIHFIYSSSHFVAKQPAII